MTLEERAVRTRTLARIVGPYMLVIGATLLARADTFMHLLPAFMADAPLVLATGAFTLIAGLCMLTAHHHGDTPAALAITFVGAAAALKGAWLMVTPELGAEITAAVTQTPVVLTVSAAFEIVVGLWLSFVGWAPPRAA